jgi:hypothetical protein
MQYLPKNYIMRYKVAKNGLIAHVYEHIAVDYINHFLLDKGKYFFINYYHKASTFNNMFYLDCTFYSENMRQLVEEAYNNFNSIYISPKIIKTTARQISNEYKRPLIKLNRNFIEEINSLHKEPWQDMLNLPVIKKIDKISVDNLFETPNIKYGKYNPKLFKIIRVYLEINIKTYEDNKKKILSLLLTYIIGSIIWEKLYEEPYVFYGSGSNLELSDKNATSYFNLTFSKNNSIKKEDIKMFFENYFKELFKERKNKKDSNLITQIKNFLIACKNPELTEFYTDLLYEKSNFVIGSKGWQELADEKLIKELLPKINIKCEVI